MWVSDRVRPRQFTGVKLMKKSTISFLCMVFLVSIINRADAAELTRIRVGILATGEFAQTYIAQKKGFFEKNGLGVELIYFQGGSQVIQAMLGGDIPLTVTAGAGGGIPPTQGGGRA